MEKVITTKICDRCKGSGSYSFNLKDGTVCYGCGGKGKVPTSPKGQKKIKPTCTSLHKAKVGDILEVSCVLYKVDQIKWIAYTVKHGLLSEPSRESNQQLIVTRLIDDKKYGFKRAVCNSEGFAIHTPEEWIGQEI